MRILVMLLLVLMLAGVAQAEMLYGRGVVAGHCNVATAGTQVRLISGDLVVPVRGVYITGKEGNTGPMYIGSADVSATMGYCISVDTTTFLPVTSLFDIWVDAGVSGNGVSYIGIKK